MQKFFCDLVSGWSTNLKKWSVQINGIQMIVITGVGISVTVVPSLITMIIGLIALFILAAAAIVAANLTQKTVATVDPTKVDVLPKDGSDGQ